MSTLAVEYEHPSSYAFPYPASSFLLNGRYLLREQVGRGGFSRVYRAEDTFNNNRAVAVKQLRLSGLSPAVRSVARETFRREAAVLSRLRHPHIPRLHEFIMTTAGEYLVLDFIAGETLADYLDYIIEPLRFEDVLEIGVQICSILHYLHQQQPTVLFLDLKPTNIMRTSEGKLFLVDFGIARLFQQGTYDLFALGTKEYCAPEQYPNEEGKAYPQPGSDIYSLGILLSVLLFGPGSPKRLQRPAIFSFARQAIPEGGEMLVVLLKAMLAHDPLQRPAIFQVSEELQKLRERFNVKTIGK